MSAKIKTNTENVAAHGSCARPTGSALQAMLIEELKRAGEESAANLGNAWFPPNGNASNPGTLAVSSALRAMERRGIVARRYVHGRGYGRTLWRLNAPNALISRRIPAE